MFREFFNSLLVLFVLLIVVLLAAHANAAPPEPTTAHKPYPIVRMLRKPPQEGQWVRNALRGINAARPGIVVPKLPIVAAVTE
jgi:hypothetical protein